MYKGLKVPPCKFCEAGGKVSNQGGIDGVPQWEVFATHKKDCKVRNKGTVQDGVTWVSLDDWLNFYSSDKCSENKIESWKGPLNVDIQCKLRVIGFCKESFEFISDEGDGYEIYPGYMKGEGPTLRSDLFEEWAEQLSYAAEWCRKKAVKLKDTAA
jgi:hypothetical protein